MKVQFKIFKDLEMYHKFVLNKNYDLKVIHFFDHNEYPNELSFTFFTDNEIIAMSALEKSPYSYEKNVYWIKHVSTNPKYQNQGFAKKLIDKMMHFAKDKNVILKPSTYTDNGLKFLKKYIENSAKVNGAELLLKESLSLKYIYENIPDLKNRAAGILFYCKSTNKILLGLRSQGAEDGGTWCNIGGGMKIGETPEEAANREVIEEINIKNQLPLHLIYIYNKENFKYYNFLCIVNKEFETKKNFEHDDIQWFNINKLPSNLHYGIIKLLPNFKKFIENEENY